jgi:hypothetical protein
MIQVIESCDEVDEVCDEAVYTVTANVAGTCGVAVTVTDENMEFCDGWLFNGNQERDSAAWQRINYTSQAPAECGNGDPGDPGEQCDPPSDPENEANPDGVWCDENCQLVEACNPTTRFCDSPAENAPPLNPQCATTTCLEPGTPAEGDVVECGFDTPGSEQLCDLPGSSEGTDDGQCDGAGQCEVIPACDALTENDPKCTAGTECTENNCNADSICEYPPLDDDLACDGIAGTCQGGQCANRCDVDPTTGDPVICAENTDECMSNVCDRADGVCKAEDDPINNTTTSDCEQLDTNPGFCDDAGTCQACNVTTQCGANEACVDNLCESTVEPPPTCDELSSGSVCYFDGFCVDLPAPTGAEAAYCDFPNLSQNPGNSLTGIHSQCVPVDGFSNSPPEIAGSLTFADATGGAWTVTGTQDLAFVIQTQVDVGVIVDVTITSNSSTALDGTGTGTFGSGGSIAMDALTQDGTDLNGNACAECAAGNINSVPSGTVICEALGPGGVNLAGVVCPLANLDPGTNILPFDGDPGQRTFPDLTFAGSAPNLVFQMGGGPTTPGGWYLVNPSNVAGKGTQWAALTGNSNDSTATGGTFDLSASVFKAYNGLLQPTPLPPGILIPNEDQCTTPSTPPLACPGGDVDCANTTPASSCGTVGQYTGFCVESEPAVCPCFVTETPVP